MQISYSESQTALLSPPSSSASSDSIPQLTQSIHQLPPSSTGGTQTTPKNHHSLTINTNNCHQQPPADHHSNNRPSSNHTMSLTINTTATATHHNNNNNNINNKMFSLETPPPSNSQSSTPSSAATSSTPTSTTPTHFIHQKSYSSSYSFPIVNFNSPTPPSTTADRSDYFDHNLPSPTRIHQQQQQQQQSPKPIRPVHQKAQSESVMRLELPLRFPSSSSLTSLDNIPMLRKKSGEVVRSSLKLSSNQGFASSSSSSICSSSRSSSYSNSRSAPSTPTQGPKAVHFDAHLEHVRHFLSQQRPIAVSRDGSPIETETEGEEEYPFPDLLNSDDHRHSDRSKLVIELPNMPLHPRLTLLNKVCLKSLELATDGKNLKGTVLVENLSFEKRVAVRFTFDSWQTVSEVTADYLSSCPPVPSPPKSTTTTSSSIKGGPSPAADLFGFTIKLQDVLARIHQREMEIAVRYLANGGEFWDNNSNANYHVKFKMLRHGGNNPHQASSNNQQQQQQQMGLSTSNGTTPTTTTTNGQPQNRKTRGDSSDPSGPWATTLRAELDRLVGDDLGLSSSSGIGGLPDGVIKKKKTHSSSFSSFGAAGDSKADFMGNATGNLGHFRAGSALSARYDFGLSLKQAAAVKHLQSSTPSNGMANGKIGVGNTHRFTPAIPLPISNVPVEWIGINSTNPHHRPSPSAASAGGFLNSFDLSDHRPPVHPLHYQPPESLTYHSTASNKPGLSKRWHSSAPAVHQPIVQIPLLPPSPPQEPSSSDAPTPTTDTSPSSNHTTPTSSAASADPSSAAGFSPFLNSGIVTPQSPSLTDDSI
ncbi:hypothetical protein PGT21_014326 [Puccinia graminis f. sp. tritici]|uniref:CBM21 domain-containing protein n=1 Tax=Puccinia graminis f. sp. tritici TaxID=56615 RepID=A0A5B0MMS6_PUCGR|nr:hypothetical protein PGT21_014326 [Puccinia graminis f. sp. tritici]KAA1102762.1 hypothetical protein PGTUg99_035341 [Puccinia graminis f. sp. tritici]